VSIVTRQPAIMRNEHLKNLQDMIVTTEQVSGSHDNADDNGSDIEEAVTLFGESLTSCAVFYCVPICTTAEDTEVLKEDEGVEITSQDDGAQKAIRKQVIARHI